MKEEQAWLGNGSSTPVSGFTDLDLVLLGNRRQGYIFIKILKRWIFCIAMNISIFKFFQAKSPTGTPLEELQLLRASQIGKEFQFYLVHSQF